MERVEDKWFPGIMGKMKREVTENFQASQIMLYDIALVDTCHYTLVEIHGMYNVKGETSGKLWILDNNDVSLKVH